MTQVRATEPLSQSTTRVALRLRTPLRWGTTVTSCSSGALPCGALISKLRGDCSCSPSATCSEPWMWLISTPGVGISASTSCAGMPTTGRVSSRNFIPIGGSDPPELTAVTMSGSTASGASARGLALALCCESGRPWPAPDGAVEDPHAHSKACNATINSGLNPFSIEVFFSGAAISAATLAQFRQRAGQLRRFVEHLTLLHQIPDIAFPETCLSGPGKGAWKGRVQPALSDPGGVIEHARRAQCLDQPQLAVIERTELAIALHDFAPLAPLLIGIAGQKHPQILDARPIQAIVQIDQQRAALLPQDIAQMTIAVQADRGDWSGIVEGGAHLFQQRRADLAVALLHVLGQEARPHEPAPRFGAPLLAVQR